MEANAPRAGANTEQAEPEMGAQGDAAALNAAGGAGGAAASPALPELAAAIEMHPGARQLYQERMDTMEALLAQGRIQQDYMDSMRNRMRTYFEAQNDIDVHILRANDPYEYVGQKVREPFEMNGGQMQDFEGTIIGYVPHQGLDQYHILYEDNDRQYRSPDQIQQLIKFYSDHHARDQVPGHAPRLQEPGHELFNALIAHNGSVAANARHNGGFNFLAQKFKAGKLFELRDLRQHLPVPPPAQLHLIMETLKEVLSITDGFPSRSDERYILREFAQHSLNLLYAFGTHTDNVKKAARMFNNGEWESL